MSVDLLHIPIEVLKEIEIPSETVRDSIYGIYNHPNPIFRYIFWGRLRAMLKMAPGSEDLRVLDYGTGFGVLLPSLDRHFREVYAIDILTDAAQRCVEVMHLRNVNLSQTDGNRLPFDDETFDIIIAADVLEHFPDPKPGIDEITRTLKKGGRLMFSGPVEDWAYRLGRFVFGKEKPDDHYHSAGQLKKMISENLRIEKCVGWPVPLLPTFLLIRASKR